MRTFLKVPPQSEAQVLLIMPKQFFCITSWKCIPKGMSATSLSLTSLKVSDALVCVLCVLLLLFPDILWHFKAGATLNTHAKLEGS